MSKVRRKTLWIHCGQHKTGSTAIQGAMQLSCQRQVNFTYVNTLKNHANESWTIRNAFQSANINVRNKHLELLRVSLAAVETESAILSAEVICHLRGSALAEFLALCDGLFDDVRVLGYIRSPISYVRSSFQETIKLKHRKRFLICNPIFIFFEELVTHIAVSKVHVYSYEKCVEEVGDVVAHFASIVGLDQENLVKASARENQSLTETAVKLLYIYRTTLCPDDSKISAGQSRNLFLSKLASIQGAPFQLGSDIADQIIAENADRMAWATNSFGCDLEVKRQDNVNGVNTVNDLLQLTDYDLHVLDRLTDGVFPNCAVGSSALNVAAAMHFLRMQCHLEVSNNRVPA